MSDKHTDALDLDKLEALARAATPGPWIAGDDEDSDLYLVGPAAFDDVVCHPVVRLHAEFNADYIAAANPETVLALIAKIRATEGQAQTSAAIDRKEFMRQVVLAVCEIPDRDSPADQPEMMLVTDYELISILESCFENADEDAAQLADSTAPGAPVGEANMDIMRELVSDFRKAAYEFGKRHDPVDHALMMRLQQQLFAQVRVLAAPTAQQSLTAGERMPEELRDWITGMSVSMDVSTGDHDAHHRYFGVVSEVMDDAHDKHGVTLLVYDATPNFAAAPLPQVQSEGPDEAPIECWSADQEDFNAQSIGELFDHNEELKPGDTVWVGEAVKPEPSQLIDADDIVTMMGERADDLVGEHADGYPDVDKSAEQELNDLLAGWINKHARPTFWTVTNVKPYVLSHDDFPNDPTPVHCELPDADQQPVTPSGALADNDGGVAK
jgi:hypothetical protein